MEDILVKIICPRCDGNGYIKLLSSPGLIEHDCPQCESQGEVFIAQEQTRFNVEGGREAIHKKANICTTEK